MPRGGARAGAGRKPGALNKKTTAIAAVVAASGISPLEVLVNAMRYHYDRAEATDDALVEVHGQQLFNVKQTLFATACDFAAKAAPYLHPRLANVEVTGGDGGPIEHNVTVNREQRAIDMLRVVRKRAGATN